VLPSATTVCNVSRGRYKMEISDMYDMAGYQLLYVDK
jgi:hypothetical protein